MTSCSLPTRLEHAHQHEKKQPLEQTKTAPARGGFTGPNVPTFAPLLGDYVNTGVRTPERRTDIDSLLRVLKAMGVRDYMHLVWTEDRYPSAWQDFQLMASQFQEANIGLWLYLTPPSEGVPDPFGEDYLRWARECAQLAKQYPIIKGICIDDFNAPMNVKKFTSAYCKQMMDAAHEIAPHLSLLVVCYFGYQEAIAEHVQSGAIDGVIFPYFFPHGNHSDTSKLLPQIKILRNWLDEQTTQAGLSNKMPLVVMVYAQKHSLSQDKPTPEYVKTCLEIGLEATKKGLTDGVVTYCLPKDKPTFTNNIARVYQDWKTEEK
ncbi:MAG: hypothetical protein D3923_14190 [Candidatus Electrothrix sp. AR3]|nr:hypothetical protein [Candidatus Electrothrix sp. AR3]